MKRLLMIAAAVAVLGLAAVAVGGAVTSADEGDGPIGTFLEKLAQKLGVTEEELQAAIDEASTETLDEGVAEGLLTEEQAERLQESEFPFRGRPWPGPRHGHVMDAAAEVLGMSHEELMEQLRDGTSLAEIAEAQMGEEFDVEDFKAALLDKIRGQLDELVPDDLTQEQSDEIYENINENIDRIVSGGGCLGGFGDPRHGPRGFGGLPLEEPASAEEAEVTA